MKKKQIILSIIAIFFLVICYVIGQEVVRPNRPASEYADNRKSPAHFYDYVLKGEELVYEGQYETTEMPGGKSVGLVEDDVYGKWYLMTPNTSITAGIILDAEEHIFSFDYLIHENVSHLSDGMQLSVKVIKEGTEEIVFEELLVADETRKEFSVDLAQWKNSNVFVKLQVTNILDDETGDWLVIENAIID